MGGSYSGLLRRKYLGSIEYDGTSVSAASRKPQT
jgi:hypothetical protein